MLKIYLTAFHKVRSLMVTCDVIYGVLHLRDYMYTQRQQCNYASQLVHLPFNFLFLLRTRKCI